MSRYNGRKIFKNTKHFYKDYMEQRGVKQITHYNTPKIKYPDPRQVADNVKRVQHIWKSTDMYWKLASQHYGDPKLWWVIAWFNKKPTESHVNIGDVIYVPVPLESVMRYF